MNSLALVVLLAWQEPANVAGEYQLQGQREMASALLLEAGGKFKFQLAYGAADYWGEGTWKLDGSAVVLQDDAAKAEPFRLTKSSKTSVTDAIRVRVVGANGRGVPNIDLRMQTVAGEDRERTDNDGVAYFRPESAPKSCRFEIPVYQFESEPYALNAAHNDFTFEINGRDITRMKFKNERLERQGDTLVFREMKYRKASPK